MKFDLIDGSGLIGASPPSGVDTIAGQGLAAGAQVVVDVATSPSFEDQRPSGLKPNAAYSRIGRQVP